MIDLMFMFSTFLLMLGFGQAINNKIENSKKIGETVFFNSMFDRLRANNKIVLLIKSLRYNKLFYCSNCQTFWLNLIFNLMFYCLTSNVLLLLVPVLVYVVNVNDELYEKLNNLDNEIKLIKYEQEEYKEND